VTSWARAPLGLSKSRNLPPAAAAPAQHPRARSPILRGIWCWAMRG
jgi:hypothetical protein